MLDGIRVLLAHYDAHEADRYRFALAREGAIVRSALTIPEAVDLVGRELPHVLASCRLVRTPNGPACPLLDAIRASAPERADAMVAVALTPWAGPELRARIEALGFGEHCPMPCGARELAEAIARAVRPKARAAGAR